jgi:hypothetical protein
MSNNYYIKGCAAPIIRKKVTIAKIRNNFVPSDWLM